VDFKEEFDGKVLYDCNIVVRRADVSIGIDRSALITKERNAFFRQYPDAKNSNFNSEDDPKMFSRFVLAVSTYPCCVAAVVTITNGPDAENNLTEHPTFEEFMELPDSLVYAWQNAVEELNPHWFPQPSKEDEELGEADGSRGGHTSKVKSSTGSATKTKNRPSPTK
jgi:hypothetical protein